MSRGALLAATAYVLWGLSPIYWRLGDHVAAADVIGFRVVATALLLVAVAVVGRSLGRLRSLVAEPRARLAVVFTAALLAANWLTFVWAVNDERVLEASLGYFINPLVSVVLGVVVLRERLERTSTIAVAIATVGVVVLTIDVGTLPWVSLFLAGTFGLYGLIRKTSPAGSLDGLTLELLVMLPFALGFVVSRAATGDGTLAASDPALDLWLVGAGAVTAAPLLLFATAARRIPLWLVGMLQFIAPTLQFLLGVVVWGEEWRGGQVVGFVLIWFALAVFATGTFAESRRVTGALDGVR